MTHGVTRQRLSPCFGRLSYLIVLILGILAKGCSSGPNHATIEGEVSLDGEPIKKGIILFTPADGDGEPVKVDIRDGRYHADLVEGNKFVQISAPRIIGQRKESSSPHAPLVDVTEESVPPCYNSATELRLEVKAGGNKKNWSLESSKPSP